MTRDICIRGANGKQYCQASPIRDCSCEQKAFKDPFPEPPTEINQENFLRDLEQLFRAGVGAIDPSEWQERLRVILVAARLVLIPQVEIMKPFVIMSMDIHTLPEPPNRSSGQVGA